MARYIGILSNKEIKLVWQYLKLVFDSPCPAPVFARPFVYIILRLKEAHNGFQQFKVALKPLRRIFFNFAKSCILTCLSLFNNKKWGSPDSFLSYKHLKAKLRGLLTGKTVAIVTSDVMKMTTTCLAMIGNLFDIIIVAATDKNL